MTKISSILARIVLAGAAALTMANGGFAEERLLLVVPGAPPTHITSRIATQFAEFVEQNGRGTVAIDLRITDAMGSNAQVLDQLREGTVDIMATALSALTPLDADLQITDWGFTFRDNEHLRAFFRSPTFSGIADRIEKEREVKILAVTPTQARSIFSTVPIDSAEDLVGLKMRVPQITAFWELWKALGTNPTPVNYAEVPIALKSGVVEAYEDNPSGAIGFKIHEIAPLIVRTEHVRVSNMIIINAARFAALSAEAKRVLTEAAEAADEWAYATASAEYEEVFQKMQSEGASVTVIDVSSLREKARVAAGVLEDKNTWRAGLFEEIQALK